MRHPPYPDYMRKIQITLFFILALFFFESGYSCREVEWSAEWWTINSTNVYTGLVVGVFAPELERYEQSDNAYIESIKEISISISLDSMARIKIFETLKGKPENIIEANISWCGSGSATLGGRVVLFGAGENWRIMNYSSSIDEVKKALLMNNKNSQNLNKTVIAQ